MLRRCFNARAWENSHSLDSAPSLWRKLRDISLFGKLVTSDQIEIIIRCSWVKVHGLRHRLAVNLCNTKPKQKQNRSNMEILVKVTHPKPKRKIRTANETETPKQINSAQVSPLICHDFCSYLIVLTWRDRNTARSWNSYDLVICRPCVRHVILSFEACLRRNN